MIGSFVFRCAHYALALGAEDLDVREDQASLVHVRLALVGDGMRIETRGILRDEELRAFAGQLRELLERKRTQAAMQSEDGSLYLALERSSEQELRVAIRLRRDEVISSAESYTGTAQAVDLAAGAAKFPFT